LNHHTVNFTQGCASRADILIVGKGIVDAGSSFQLRD